MRPDVKEEILQKRTPGLLSIDNTWSVITESQKVEQDGLLTGYKHSCGADILGTEILVSFRDDDSIPMVGGGQARQEVVPYCPNCELEPSNGIFIESTKTWIIF